MLGTHVPGATETRKRGRYSRFEIERSASGFFIEDLPTTSALSIEIS